MINLSIVTLTRDIDNPMLKKCRESVEQALLPGIKHEIIVCKDKRHFNQMRYETSKLNEYVAIVDDDDTITKDAISLCVQAIEKHNLDVVFTDELNYFEGTGISEPCVKGIRRYSSIALSPVTVHHLVMMKSSKIEPVCLELAERYTVGIDWFTVASVMFTGKAAHIQKPCYNWTQRFLQDSKINRELFNANFRNMQKSIAETWTIPKGNVPIV
jgi:hypothetical protein